MYQMKNNWQLVPVMIDDHQYNLESNDLYLAIQQYTEMAFGKKTREDIRDRANNRSEVSGRDDMPLEASHFFHGRGESEQHQDNGILLTLAEHLVWHKKYENSPEDIGLNKAQNDWAIGQIFLRLAKWVTGRGGSYEEVGAEIDNAQEDVDNAWKDYF
jgi:hypothetical protein